MSTILHNNFNKMEGGSTDQETIVSETNKSSTSSDIRSHKRKEFLREFVGSDIFSANLEKWLEELAGCDSPAFEVPFELIDVQNFGYALEGVLFQQLIRMPSGVYASGADEAATYLAIEDFLHASAKGLWEAFWSQDDPMPFHITCVNEANLKFYQVEKAIADGKLGGLCATGILLNNPRHRHGKWDDILQLALVRPNMRSLLKESNRKPSLCVIGEALFYALRILLSRSLSSSNTNLAVNSVFVLLIDSQYGGVLKVEGDLSKLKFGSSNVYECAADWIKDYSHVAVSPIHRIWNDLGNANWGDIGALQLLCATFHSILQFTGLPTNSIEDLAADHSSRLQIRRAERQLGDTRINRNDLFRLQQHTVSPEIVEVQEEFENLELQKLMKLEVGSVLWLEDSNRRKGYLVNEILSDEAAPFYIASPVEDQGNALFLYVGSHSSQMESALEDMKLWYQVQRQTKILTIMKQKGLSSKYLPHLSASGRMIHPGQCQRPTSSGNCSHPWCGTPILATSPVGRSVADLIVDGQFGPDEMIRCCHDCLSALSTAASAGIRHGDLRPENVICVSTGPGQPHFVLIGWGHAILEDRDRAAMNLHFSSTYALQEGKLCSASDAESLVYLLYFCCGGELPELDSVEGALLWRETSWSKRFIQQRLGNISAVVKAFADYVDSLCGTPYPMNYENWLRRLKKHMNEEGCGKEIGSLD